MSVAIITAATAGRCYGTGLQTRVEKLAHRLFWFGFGRENTVAGKGLSDAFRSVS